MVQIIKTVTLIIITIYNYTGPDTYNAKLHYITFRVMLLENIKKIIS